MCPKCSGIPILRAGRRGVPDGRRVLSRDRIRPEAAASPTAIQSTASGFADVPVRAERLTRVAPAGGCQILVRCAPPSSALRSPTRCRPCCTPPRTPHSGLDDWHYELHECDEAGLAGFVAGLDGEWAGLSLTMPLKRVALDVAAEVSPLASATGAANTLVLRDGRRFADNTDVAGTRRRAAGSGSGRGEACPAGRGAGRGRHGPGLARGAARTGNPRGGRARALRREDRRAASRGRTDRVSPTVSATLADPARTQRRDRRGRRRDLHTAGRSRRQPRRGRRGNRAAGRGLRALAHGVRRHRSGRRSARS